MTSIRTLVNKEERSITKFGAVTRILSAAWWKLEQLFDEPNGNKEGVINFNKIRKVKSLWRKEPHRNSEIKTYKSESQISFKGPIDRINKEFGPISIFPILY